VPELPIDDRRALAESIAKKLNATIAGPDEIADTTFREFQFRYDAASNRLGCWVYVGWFYPSGPLKANPYLLEAVRRELAKPDIARKDGGGDGVFKFDENGQLFLVWEFEVVANADVDQLRSSVLAVRRTGAIWRTKGLSALMDSLIPGVRQRMQREAERAVSI